MDQIKGKLHEVKGKAKEKVGQATNSPNLAAEGQDEKLAGKIQRKIGQVEKVFEKQVTSPPPSPKEDAVNKTLGMILIALGLFGLAWGGFTYTTRETVVDIGPIHATSEKIHNVPLSPIAGAVALIGGVVLLVAGRKK